MFVFKDKCRNVYMLQPGEYLKLSKKNLSRTYKKSTLFKKSILFNIKRTAKRITEKLSLSDRIDKMLKREAFITKDHKKNFQTKFHVALLILQSLASVGKISKVILDKTSNITQL